MKKEKLKAIEVGDIIIVDIVEPKFGKFPIGRAHDGRICKLVLPENIKFLEYGCTVSAYVGIVNTKSLTVEVEEIIRSKSANDVITANKVLELKSTIPTKTKHIKPKKGVYVSRF